MKFKPQKLLFILLLVIVVFLAGCNDKLFVQYAGKNIGVYVFYDAPLIQPFEYQNSLIPASDITLSLVKHFRTFQKKITAIAITPEVIKDNNIQDETYQKQLFSDLTLDNLLLLKIIAHTVDYYSTPINSKKNSVGGPVDFINYDKVYNCAVTIDYQLLGKDELTPLFSGTSKGRGELKNLHFGPGVPKKFDYPARSKWVINYDQMLSMISEAIIWSLKKAKL